MEWRRDGTRIGYLCGRCGFQADVTGVLPAVAPGVLALLPPQPLGHRCVFRQQIHGIDVCYAFRHDFHEGFVQPGTIAAPQCLQCSAPVVFGQFPCPGHVERRYRWTDSMDGREYVCCTCAVCEMTLRPAVLLTRALWDVLYALAFEGERK